MRDRKEERRWGIILAREFGVPPDDIDVETFLDCVSRSKSTNRELLIVPQTKAEEVIFLGPYARDMLEKLTEAKYPFNDWLYTSFVGDIDDYSEGFLN